MEIKHVIVTQTQVSDTVVYTNRFVLHGQFMMGFLNLYEKQHGFQCVVQTSGQPFAKQTIFCRVLQ